MLFNVDLSRGEPVYARIMAENKRRMARGTLKPGDRLPSVRELARALVISPNTAAKAYQSLETDGVPHRRLTGRPDDRQDPSHQASSRFPPALPEAGCMVRHQASALPASFTSNGKDIVACWMDWREGQAFPTAKQQIIAIGAGVSLDGGDTWTESLLTPPPGRDGDFEFDPP